MSAPALLAARRDYQDDPRGDAFEAGWHAHAQHLADIQKGKRVDRPNYTIKTAAARVGRSPRTIERWIHNGLKCRTVAGMLVIDHDPLMAYYRDTLKKT